ncbi:hypothetical protein GRF29_44g378388 [Pseudopithomyces chartarum]|uniref:BRCT domain-containing protein n=1 Tax=Pseudopithomyces chartarum TaxID=1892770 RepID=A0AAN6M260_9PLEO|nr:hypothetical protein GRF29_44g378388 [Pseudopithomyces chartarum]
MGVLKGLTIALAGDIKDSSTPPKSISLEQLKRWIHANGGTYAARVTERTTHLVASKEAFKRGIEPVQAARLLPTPIPIVTFAWLEDSLHKRRRLVERKYTNPPPASTNATPPPSTSPLSSIPNLLPTFPSPPPTSQPSNPANAKLQDLYHIYIDATGFEYKLLLLRHHHQHNTFARYDLRLYESHSLPHVYCTLVRYTPPALPPSLPSSLPTLPSSTTPTTQHPLPTSTTPPQHSPPPVRTGTSSHPPPPPSPLLSPPSAMLSAT